ncbi:putative hemin transport protein HmuS [Leptospira ryugenii]|uniref:Putative hemin transport protein HmuS n=1 Tax=Leptospira ryugenii TaxID=1917863 RepID=A0A2P2E2A6_9LEPT|nr:ChuX/HutX family heme-like substrate-binding protein [Leptospira ryugenii]GBF51033.1 putative hemin transport protein HmuS [Leptospira ryugenii]
MNTALAESWQKLKKEAPNVRIRDAAASLGVSELELLATRIGTGVSPLKENWTEFLIKCPSLGRVMALTRNDFCVHERKGSFEHVSVHGKMGLVTGPEIDLRIFLNQWRYGFFVEDTSEERILYSVQFFDGSGEAVFKLYATEESDLASFLRLKNDLQKLDGISQLNLEPKIKEQSPVKPQLDKSTRVRFLESWSNLKDTHDFFTLLNEFNVERMDALEIANGRFTSPWEWKQFESLLKLCVKEGLEIMVFVGSKGVIQIHTGLVETLEERGPWFNILDKDFNLHLRKDFVSHIWFVNKPTLDGTVSSLELFSENGELILQCFGKRKPGQPQSKLWEKLIDLCQPKD